MTLAIATATSSGIILSADSRQTYRNQAGVTRIGSDSAMKLFQLNDRVGVVIAGRAFLPDANGDYKNTGYFIDEFRRKSLKPDWETKKIAEELERYLAGLFVTKELSELQKQIAAAVQKESGSNLALKDPDGPLQPFSYKTSDDSLKENSWAIETISIIVAGIDFDGVGRAYNILVPKRVDSNPTNCSTQRGGALWIGQTDVVTRIVRGWTPEIWNLPIVKQAGIADDLNKFEYIINWATMTLQDAVDFCLLVTRTTENIQRFSDGTILQPGGITGVGGNIDVAAITPEKGFCWLKRKMLAIDGINTNIDEKANLSVRSISE